MHVTVIGLGLIGGSWSLALKEKFSDITLTGYDLERKHRDKALTLGLIDKVAESLEESIQGSEWIFLCTPSPCFRNDSPIRRRMRLRISQIKVVSEALSGH